MSFPGNILSQPLHSETTTRAAPYSSTARRRLALVLAVAAITLLAAVLRLRAVYLLPIDYDEDDYLGAAQYYARAMAAGDLAAIINYDYNYEHPPLTKLVYGLVILPLPQAPAIETLPASAPPAATLPQPHFEFARLTSAALGTLEVLALAILNPLGGLFLAIDTWQIKYTSQVMLEPLPSLTSALAVLFYVKSRSRWNRWLFLSAVALGLTAAGKFTYCVAGLAIVIHWLTATRPDPDDVRPAQLARWLGPLAAWSIVSVLVFFAFDPRLWVDSFSRFKQMILYHGDYATSAYVQKAGFPPWQPLVWLAESVPWAREVFLVGLDLVISILAVVGFRRLWHKQRVFALWLAVALIFLLLWPTKWPQYILTLTAPLALAAAEGFQGSIWEPLSARAREIRAHGLPRPKRDPVQAHFARQDARRALPWLVPGVIVLALIAVFPLVFQAAMALTDFNAISIRDGMNGGVWRAVWQGLTGQVSPVGVDPFGGASRSVQVRYAGPELLLSLVSGAATDILVFNVMWTVLSVGLQAALGVLAALMLNRRGVRLRKWWRAIFILPWAIPEFVGALVWLRIFEPHYGWLTLAGRLPLDIVIPKWGASPLATLAILLIAATWYGFPFIMLAATAGLKLMPDEVYDAAALDGASGWTRFRTITWPLLLPLLTPALIIRSIFAFNQFYLFYTMQTSWPFTTLATVSYTFFSPIGYFGGQFGVSAAINLFTVLVLVLLIVWFNRRTKAAEGVTYV